MKHKRILQEGLYSCRCSTTSHGDQKTTRKNAKQMLNSFLCLQEDSEQDNGHSSDLDRRKSGLLSVKIVHYVNGTKWRKDDVRISQESRHPVFRATSPLSRGKLKSKGGGKLSIHNAADLETITTVFRTIASVNQPVFTVQSQKCVKNMNPITIERETRCGRKVEFLVVPSVSKTNVPLNNDDLAHNEFLLQRYGERIEKLSQQDKLSKFCMDAGFLTVC